MKTDTPRWIEVGLESDFLEGLGVCIQHFDEQIAVFNFNGDDWYAVQNLNPFNKQMVLSRGLTGTLEGEPKVACPLHKQNVSLRSGEFLGEGDAVALKTYPVKRENSKVFIQV